MVDGCCSTNSAINLAANIMMATDATKTSTSLLRPRLSGRVRSPMKYLISLFSLLAVVLVLPIPLGNVLPALAISLLALGVLERDGVWVLAGIGVAMAPTSLVSGVIFAMSKTSSYFFAQVLS